ncbi:hypothetical protein [Nostoc sp. CALU 1950]|uniref:hypothetical protein n=1 Tax=Nostoc sp. CALU 1950 TaxID=3104321 RepID=UPI003EBF3E4F
MQSDQKPSQNFSISGGQLSDVQIGGQSGRDLTANQSQQNIEGVTDQPLTSVEVTALLEQLKGLLQSSDLPSEQKDKAIRSIETANDEIQAEKPDKEFAAKSLQRATKVLKEAGETVQAGTSLWQRVKPILETISPWLGVASSFLI